MNKTSLYTKSYNTIIIEISAIKMFFNNNKILDVKIMQIFYALIFLSQILAPSSIWILLLAVLISANGMQKIGMRSAIVSVSNYARN